MTRAFCPPPPERVAEVRRDAERQLTPEQFDAYVNAPMSSAEREGIAELVAWFTRRYPTPAARLAYARSAYQRWRRAMPPER